MNDKIIFQFLKNKFPVKKIKTNRKKWANAIIIPEGYLRKERKSYTTKENINKAQIVADIMQIIINIFDCNQSVANKITFEYLKTIRL